MKKLLIVGTSSNSKLARYYFEMDTPYKVHAYIINMEYITDALFDELPVLSIEEISNKCPPQEFDAFVAVGYNKMNGVRKNLYEEIKKLGYFLPNYISPRCTFLSNEAIGDNNFILEDNTIQPFVKIGSNNVVWSGNHIGHDVVIGNHNFITSHAVISGFTKIKERTFIGVNATIRDGISIENETLIAAGATIMQSTNEKGVYLPPKTVLLDKKSDEIKIS